MAVRWPGRWACPTPHPAPTQQTRGGLPWIQVTLLGALDPIKVTANQNPLFTGLRLLSSVCPMPMVTNDQSDSVS